MIKGNCRVRHGGDAMGFFAPASVKSRKLSSGLVAMNARSERIEDT